MDNYYVDKPLWRVDLGTKNTINGAVILTWQGAGQGMFNFTMRGRQYFFVKKWPPGFFMPPNLINSCTRFIFLHPHNYD